MTHKTLVELLRWRAEHQADKRAYTFLVDGKQHELHMTYGELHQWAQSIANHLLALDATGERALLLYPSGLEFIAAFFGCLYAGVVAVPTYPPRKRNDIRFQAIATDAQAGLILTTSKILADMERWGKEIPWVIHRIATDQLPMVETASARMITNSPDINSDTLAFLQYTSGSTSTPKGVMVSHGNLVHNQRAIQAAFGHTIESITCGWLPMFHDMGLIGNVLQSFYTGFPCILMPPTTFIEQPIRWLQAISRYRATSCVAPNFAYDLCVDKTTPEQRERLDLSSWQGGHNAAEPIHLATLERFFATFEPYGLRWGSLCPGYGLAEATLLVSGGTHTEAPIIFHADPEKLKQSQVVPSETRQTKAIVGCGRTWGGQQIAIVDPKTSVRCEPEQIGEIWLKGDSVAQGYWQKPEVTAETFHARIADTDEGPFLRTGDLGFMRGTELFVTGRLKNMIIIRGRNYYAHDIERAAEQSHLALQPTCSAAFAIDDPKQAKGEQLVVVCELQRQHRRADVEEVAEAIRGAISQLYEIQVYGVVLLRPGQMPKTTSGKVQHYLCKEKFLSDTLSEIGRSIIHSEPTQDGASTTSPEVEPKPIKPQIKDRAHLTNLLRTKMAELLGVPATNVNFSQPLDKLGLGSLHAIELQHYIETEFGVEISVEIFFEEINTEQLIDRIVAGVPLMPEVEAEIKVEKGESRAKLATDQLQFSLLFFSADTALQQADNTPAYKLLQDAARFADQHNFSAIWLPERHFHSFGGLYPNPATLAASLAPQTEQVRLRAGSIVLPLNNPIRVAEDWAVIDNLSSGRVDLSFATGWNPNDFVLAPDAYEDRVANTYRGMNTIQQLWQGQPVTLPNGLGQEHTVQIYPQPVQPTLNLWLTCSGGPQRFIDAGEQGYNVLTALLFQSFDELGEKIRLYREARARHGYDPKTGHVTLMLHTYVGETMAEVRETVKQPFMNYLEISVDLWRQQAQPLAELSQTERHKVLHYAFERYFQTSALIGTPESCVSTLESLVEIGVNEVACLIDFGVESERVMAGLQMLQQLRTKTAEPYN